MSKFLVRAALPSGEVTVIEAQSFDLDPQGTLYLGNRTGPYMSDPFNNVAAFAPGTWSSVTKEVDE